MAKRKRTKPGHAKRDDGCTCDCESCPDDCSSCDHEGCDAEAEDCGPDCPMSQRSLTRDLPPLSLRASFSPSTLDEENRTVEVIWTTGEPVLRGYFDRFWEQLSLAPGAVRMGRLQSGKAPLLNSHSAYDVGDVIGVVDSSRLEPARGVAVVRFARDDKSSAIMAKVKDGILSNISVGYRIHKMEKIEDVNEKIPTYRAVDWEPYELSIVPVGADAGAVVRAAGATNPCEFVAEERKMAKLLKKEPQGSVEDPGAAAEGETEETRAAADGKLVTDERERVLSIQRTAETFGLGTDLAAEHVGKNTTVAQFRALAERAYEKKDPRKGIAGPTDATTIRAGEDEREKWFRGAGDWLLQRSSVATLVAEDAKKRGEPIKIDGGEFRGLRMLDLARMCLERSGVRTKGMLPMELFAAALEQRSVAGAASTGDFPVLLENTLHKILLASYGTTTDTWSQFCTTGTVSDFRPHKRYRLGSFSAMQPLNEAGEFANKPIPDATKESISAGTKGNIIAITRQALVNDDLSAFNQLSTMLGRAARLSIETDVYQLLALNAGLGPLMNDGLTLFHATHANIGAPAVLSVASVEADRVLMGSQKDPSGNEFLELRPAILVLALGLGGVARVINNAQYDVDPVAANATNMFQKPNKVVGLYQQVVDTARISGTRRYSFAPPTLAPTIEVAFLDGQQQPFMEMQQGWRIDGVEWKVRLDYAVGAVDVRGAVTNAGQ